jgi:hypothetical protein
MPRFPATSCASRAQRPNKSGTTWLSEKQPAGAGFDAVFRFQLMHQDWLFRAADGLAFVLQNSSPAALGGQGSAGGFGAPDPTNTHRAGIPWMASSTLSLGLFRHNVSLVCLFAKSPPVHSRPRHYRKQSFRVSHCLCCPAIWNGALVSQIRRRKKQR